MTDKLETFKKADAPVPEKYRLWPLYGAGLENLGQDKHTIEVSLPAYGPDELLVRHDAIGLCFSDTKVINQGEDHPRIYRKMKDNPVVLGHEVTLVVVGVGDDLKDQYKVGDRFIVQADIYIDEVSYAYGYELQGGLSEYNVIDQRVLNGDHGNYLLPVQETTGYAESALTEPWACVIAAYGLEYRTTLKHGGTTWIIGTDNTDLSGYTISEGLDADSHPSELLLTNVPDDFGKWLREQATALNIEVIDAPDVDNPPVQAIDDIVLLGTDADLVEKVSPHLSKFGILAVVTDKPFERNLDLDMGRIHYHRWLYVGGSDPDIAKAYNAHPVDPEITPGGRSWFVGAGGPMGRMHVQRAIQMENHPSVVVCTDVSEIRLNDLRDSFADEAREKGIAFVCLNPVEDAETYKAEIAKFKDDGFDDIVVMAPVAPVIADSANYMADNAVMNVFAGIARGKTVNLNLNDVIFRNVRYIGHSGSSIEDLRLMLSQAESGVLSPNRAVAAVGSMEAAWDGLEAVKDATFPGKIVIYPHIKDLPLTPLAELKDKMPTVYEKLKDGREWTNEAEEEFLRLMLK